MNKQQLIKAIAKDIGITETTARATLDATMGIITQELARGDDVVLVGFGTFKPAKRKARLARNPKTGEPINVPAKVAVTFTAGKALKDTVNR